jgi:hypothetical protein
MKCGSTAIVVETGMALQLRHTPTWSSGKEGLNNHPSDMSKYFDNRH